LEKLKERFYIRNTTLIVLIALISLIEYYDVFFQDYYSFAQIFHNFSEILELCGVSEWIMMATGIVDSYSMTNLSLNPI
jgi:hypothetical protein